MTDAGALARFLERHPRVLVLTGAGCSTASGIPDYRDAAGAYKQRPPMSFAEFTGSEAARRRYWSRSLLGWPRVRDARPNPAHAALARLEALGRVAGVVTQNVDGLHQRAGSRQVLDLHGRLDGVECLGCGVRLARDDVQALLVDWNPEFAPAAAARPEADAGRHAAARPEAAARPDGDALLERVAAGFRVPDCPACGGVLKPAVVFFGESVPRARVEAVHAELARADALLVVGSSLMVYSGYRFALRARELGRPVAALNIGRTRADEMLALKLAADCAALLPAAVAALAQARAGAAPEAGA